MRYIQQTTVCHAGQQWHTLSLRTATTRFSPESRLPERNGAKWAVTSQAFTRWRHQSGVELIWWIALLLIYRPGKDERLSWPSWLACSGRFTHVVVTRRLQAERRTGSVRRPRTNVLPTVLRNQPFLTNAVLQRVQNKLNEECSWANYCCSLLAGGTWSPWRLLEWGTVQAGCYADAQSLVLMHSIRV